MKFLPFTISVGKSLDRMLDEKLEKEDLNPKIARAQRRGNQDFAIGRKPRTLPLRETLYQDIERPGKKAPYDSDRVIVRAYSCGLKIPNSPVISEEDIHYDNKSSQRQVIISEDLMLARDVYTHEWRKPFAKVLASYMNPFPKEDFNNLDYRMVENFTREFFRDEHLIANALDNLIGTIGGARDDSEFGKHVYEIKLIVPSESNRRYSPNLYGNVLKELEKLGYKKHERRVCLA